MNNVTKFPITFFTRIKLWWNKYKQGVGKRLDYLERKSKE